MIEFSDTDAFQFPEGTTGVLDDDARARILANVMAIVRALPADPLAQFAAVRESEGQGFADEVAPASTRFVHCPLCGSTAVQMQTLTILACRTCGKWSRP